MAFDCLVDLWFWVWRSFLLDNGVRVISEEQGTPVNVPHIDFDEPTGNPQVEARKSYGLMILSSDAPDLAAVVARLAYALQAFVDAWHKKVNK